MKLTHTRPEKNEDTERAAYAMRDELSKIAVQSELNHAEMINTTAHVFASILAGAYDDEKSREAVISMLPDIIRLYIPEWEKIYARFIEHTEQSATN